MKHENNEGGDGMNLNLSELELQALISLMISAKLDLVDQLSKEEIALAQELIDRSRGKIK